MSTASGEPVDDGRLDLVPAPASSRAWLFVLAAALPIGLTAMVLALAGPPAALPHLAAFSDATHATPAVLGGVAILSLTAWFLLDRLVQRHALRLEPDRLVVKSGFNTCKLALSDLRLDQARTIDLDERTEYRPMLKLNGTGLPGFRSGWYLLRDRSRAFVAMAGGRRALWIPTRRHHVLLLQARQPQPLLDALREMASTPARR